MPGPKLSGIYQPDLMEFTAELGSESVTVKFDRNKLTLREELEVEKAIEAGETQKVIEPILRLFHSWDVVDDNGAPVEMSQELLLSLPSRAIVSLFEGMQREATPSSEEGNGSSDTSSSASTSSTPTQASPQNGPAPSPLPAPLASQSPK
jgi:hypothetical protein